MQKRSRLIWPALIISCCVAHDAPRASAHPTTSPSARAAARLKYRPPANWIRHYLGDDRYKIAGNVWKVVSTQNDTYFHRPTCPNMLRQPAGIVLGFASPADAFEAGYMPCPTCQPAADAFSYGGGGDGGMVTTSSGGMDITVNRGKAKRIVLSDGVSTAILPSGWTRMSPSSSVLGAQASQFGFKIDLFAPSGTFKVSSRRVDFPGVMFGFFNYPGAEQSISNNSFEKLTSYFERSGTVNNRASNLVNSVKVVNRKKFAGLTAMTLSSRASDTPLTIAARGSKVYLIAADPAAGAAGKGMVRSFQPK